MIGPQLQEAVFGTLTTANICDGRIFDRVEGDPAFPYITIGDEEVGDIGNGCVDAWESTVTVHVWSRPMSGSRLELKALLAEIQPLLCTTALVVSGFKVATATLETVRALKDPDGQTFHGVLSVSYSLYPTS